MKQIIISLITTLVVAVLGIAGAYLQRGYWAFGMEYVLPVVVLALLLFSGGKEHEL